MDPEIPEVGAVIEGYRFKGGDPAQESSWEPVGSGPAAAGFTPLGGGWWRAPDGATYQEGRGGALVQRTGATGGSGSVGDIREFEANAAARATLMDQGERDYQAARRAGYNPGSAWNATARRVEGVPIIGVPLSNIMRSDVADRGRAAELQFVDGALRTTTGANAPEPEVVRADRSYFIQGGEGPGGEAGKEALRNRFRDQSIRVAGDAYIPGGVDTLGSINPETGLPSYPTIQRLTQNATELPLTPQEMGSGPSDPENGPGSSESNPFVLEGSNSTDVYNALKDGGWVQGPDGRVYELPPGVVRFAAPEDGDVQVSPGVFQRAQTPEEEVSERGRMNGILRRVDAFVRGAADTATFGLADEIAAGAETVLPLTGGASGWSEGFGNAYRQNIARERAVDRSDAQAVPVSRISGQVAGALGNPGTAAGARFISRAPNLGYAMTRSAAVGAPAGALYGAGAAEGGLPERGQGMMTGGVAGALTGAALPPVGAAARFLTAPIARPVGNFISDTARAATGRGLTPDEKAARALLRGRDPAAMRTAADEMRSFGAQPTVADVGGSVVQGRTRVAATRQGEGRQVAEDFAAGRRSDIQDYTSGLGRIVSDTEATPSQIEGMLEQYQRQASAPAFGAVRGDRISLDESSVLALRSPEGRKAIKDAANLYLSSTNADDRAIAAELNRLADDVLDQPGQVQITVGGADLMSRYLAKAGGQDANRNRVFGGLGRAIRQNAAEQSPGYGEALTGFAQRARLGDANEIGQRFTGKGTARDFVAGVENMGPDGRQIARMAARSGIEKAAETPAGSMGMLDRLAVGRGQRQRSEALLDPAEAQRLQRGGQIGRQLVSTAQNVNPRAGSNTFLNFADGEEMAGGGVIGNALRGRFLTAAGGAIDLMRSRGISGDQADRIVSLALDPARTDEAIQILSTRLSPGVAARTVEAIQRAANPAISAQMGGAQGGQQSRAVSMTNPTF